MLLNNVLKLETEQEVESLQQRDCRGQGPGTGQTPHMSVDHKLSEVRSP